MATIIISDKVKFQTEQKTKAALVLFHDLFINGDEGSKPNEFDGIDQAVTGSSTELIPDAAINLSSSTNIDTNWKVFLDNMRKLRARLVSFRAKRLRREAEKSPGPFFALT